MATDKDHVFGVLSDGLDRAEIGTYVPAGPKQQRRSQHETLRKHTSDNPKAGRHSLPALLNKSRDSVKKLKTKLRDKAKDAADRPHTQHEETAPILAPSAAQGIEDNRLGSALDEKSGIPPIKDFLQSPIATVKSVITHQGGDQFASNVAQAEVSHGASVEMLRQSQKIDEATTQDDIDAETEELVQLKQIRQDTFVRWTMDRHVRKVGKTTEPPHPRRKRKDFLQKDDQGNERMQWQEYLQYVSQQDAPDILR